jgi:hypothetical protein
MAMLSASLVVNFGASQCRIEDGFINILDGPTGFMMIKRTALEAMHERYPELNCKNDHQNRDFDDYCAVFDCMIDPVSKRYVMIHVVLIKCESHDCSQVPLRRLRILSSLAANGRKNPRGRHDDARARGKSAVRGEPRREA